MAHTATTETAAAASPTTDATATPRENVRAEAAPRLGMCVRHRQLLTPWCVMAAAAAVGGIGRVVVLVSGGAHVAVAGVVVAAACVVAAAGYGVWRHVADRAPQWPRLAATAVAAATWTVAATLVGINWNMLAALLAGGVLAALPTWRDHRIAWPDLHAPAAAPRVDTGDDVDDIVGDWRRYLADDNGVLKGSRLTGREIIDAGVRYCAMLVRGKQTWRSVQQAQELIASAVDMTPERIVIEAGDTACRATVTFVQRPPVVDAPTYAGPTYDPETGCVDIGMFIDGEDTPKWRVYTKNSAWGGFICGGTGMGKSRALEIIAMSLMASGNTVVLYGDPSLGTSSSGLSQHAAWAVRGVDGIKTMLAAVQRVIDYRQAENAAEGWDGFDPHTQNRPGVCVIIDESHLALADPEVRDVVENIVRVARKLGIFIILASQVATLDAFGGSGNSADAIRSNICGGNALAFKTSSNNTKQAIAELEVDPTKLPATPGYSYLIDKGGNSRTAPLRTHQLPDDMTDLWDKAARLQAALDPGAAHVAGDDYTRRHEQAAVELTRMREYVAAVRAGAQPRNPLHAAPQNAAQPAVADLGFHVVDLPTFPLAMRDVDVETGDVLTESQRVLLDAIAGGADTPVKQQTATGWSERHCRNMRNDLLAAGRLERVGHGRYRVRDLADAAA